MVIILRLWVHGYDQPEWIAEVQDVQTGTTAHVQGLDALFDLLKQKAIRLLESPKEKRSEP
jgi:hypothetical protein